MAKIAVTGAKGTVGKALVPKLATKHEVIEIDLPEIDATDTKKLTDVFRGADTVIHLAGVFGPASEGKENWLSPYRDPINNQLFMSALEAAKASGVKLFIHASSIHVEDSIGHMQRHPGDLLVAKPRTFVTEPSSGYGLSKREQEAILEDSASQFERGAVSIRLGGVTPNGLPVSEHPRPEVLEHERRVWLDHDELGALVLGIIDQQSTPEYGVLYAVSDNTGRFHDLTNSYGWVPKANSQDHE